MRDLTEYKDNWGQPIAVRKVTLELSLKELKLLVLLAERPPKNITENDTLFADSELIYEELNDFLGYHVRKHSIDPQCG